MQIKKFSLKQQDAERVYPISIFNYNTHFTIDLFFARLYYYDLQ